MAAEDAVNTTQRGLLELRRRQMMGQPAAGTPATPAAGTPATPAAAPTLSPTQSRMKFYADQQAKRVAQTSGASAPTTPAAPASTTTPVATTPAPSASPAAKPASTVPPLLARPRPSAPQGMIDGKPAGQVLSGMRDDAARGTTPAQTYGADVANRNIAERGPQAAIEDYFNRNRLDAQRAPMPTEPGSMAERRAVEGRSLMQGPAAPGPAQRAMTSSLQNPNVPYTAPDTGLSSARAAAAGSSVLRTPTTSAAMDFRTSLRDQPTQRAMRGEVTPVTPPGREKPPALARPSPQAPAAEAPSLAYTMGQKTRNAPAAYQSAKATAALGLYEARVRARAGAKKSADFINQARASAALTLARGARDFGAGFSGQ